MAWTEPKTWTAEVLTSSDLNTHLRDNLSALKNPPSDFYTFNEGSDYTTTSTSFTNVDGTDLSFTIVTYGGDLIVHFDGYCANGAGYVLLDVTIDGVRQFGDDGAIKTLVNSGGPISFTRIISGIAAGSRVVNLVWKVAAGTGTMYAGAGTANFDIHPQFWVREVS